jgi:N-acetylglucosamine-6-phosphate deacetylase
MLVIENGTVYAPTGAIPGGGVLINGGRIEAVGKRDELTLPDDVQHLDARGGLIAPGFVNIHIHGVGGYGTDDGEVASLEAMSLLLTRHGVTSWVPTTTSRPLVEIVAACAVIREAMADADPASGGQEAGAEILGGHIEGPYLSPQERGAHPEELLIEPRLDEYSALLDYADVIRIFTLAPELPGALNLIRELKNRGIVVSAGHSVAIDEEFTRAVDAGLSHAAHMFCNMGTLRRANLRRVAGLVESILLDDRVTTELITDGYVIAPSLMKLGLKVKGVEKLAIITDGSSLTGLPPGSYHLLGSDVILEEDIAYVADRSSYAGTAVTMDHCVRVAIESMDLSLEDAFRMASLTPATILGVSDRKGSLEVGKDADVVILDEDLRVMQTVARGHVFEATSEICLEEGGALGWRISL